MEYTLAQYGVLRVGKSSFIEMPERDKHCYSCNKKETRFAQLKPIMSVKRILMFGWMIGLFLVPFVQAQQPDPSISSPPIQQGSYFSNLPTQPIGPNDLIGVSVYGSPELSGPVRVDANETALTNSQNSILGKGLYPSQLETTVADALKKGNVLVDPIVTVTIMEYQSRPVSVMGAVNKPLVFQVSQPTSLLEALARAGGTTQVAGPNILVTHSIVGQNGKSVQATQTIPTRSLIDLADPSLNITLHGGDEILVPQAHKIYVLGNVKTPGAFPVQDNGYTTVLQGLALAGGLSPDAHKLAYIFRKDGSGAKQEIPIQLAKIMKRKSPDVHLKPDDILYVPDNGGKRFAKTLLEYTIPAAAGAAIYALLVP